MLFEKNIVPFDKTRLFSDLILDFASHNNNVKSFVRDFSSLESISSYSPFFNQVNRKKLVTILKKQYNKTVFKNQNLEKIYSNIDLLLNDNAYVITTGHQINLFISPLFLIYKITSVIAYSKYLNENIKEKCFIPFFWMATEDNDFHEINSAYIFDKNYTWDLDHKNAVGNLSNKEILPLLTDLEKDISNNKYGEQLCELYRFAYTHNTDYANANRSLLTSFFSDHGLVIVDGNHVDLKKEFINDFKSEVNNQFVYNTVNETNKKIREKYKPQINPQTSNIFYLHDSIRSKIQLTDQKYFSKEHQKEWSKLELLNEIELHPDRFSPNVFLRTLYQQRILPNVLYVGGPSEIAYWLQTKELFEHFNIEYPCLQLRNFFLILSKNMANFQLKYDLSDIDLFNHYDVNIKKIIQEKTPLKSEELLGDIDIFLSVLEQKIQKINNFPMNSFEVFKSRVYKAFSKLESKKNNFEKNQHKNLLNQLFSFQNKITPNHSMQEQVASFIPYYIKYGHDFFELLIQESTIFEDNYIILTEHD